MKNKTILVTGGTGFIGSHTCVELLQLNYEVIIVDNLSNSKRGVLNRIYKITKKHVKFYNYDLRDVKNLDCIFKNHTIFAVIHFAALKSGADSIKNPGLYYDNNIESTVNLVHAMKKYNVKYLIFSSSATVYGNSQNVPIIEEEPIGNVISPYGMSKYLLELYLKDISEKIGIKTIALRYFNPIGAHPSGYLGEDSPDSIPNNLMLYLLDVAHGNLPFLNIFGNDYNTKDGSGIRDYIHVVDLAKGHIAALQYVEKMNQYFDVFNLGTGKGYTVLELVNTFEKVNNVKIPIQITKRRPGDVEKSFASVKKANKFLKWKTQKSLQDCLKDAFMYKKII